MRSLDPKDRLLKATELAERFGVTTDCLYEWRRRERGPRWFKLLHIRNGGIRYRLSDVIEWENSHAGLSTASEGEA